MNGFRTTVRRALDRAPRLTTALRAAPTLALALAAALLASALGPPAPAGAAAEPAARLQVVIKEVYIHNDRDGALLGDGELRLYAGIWRCNQGIAPPCFNEDFQVNNHPRGVEIVTNFMTNGSLAGTGAAIARAKLGFEAGTGEHVPLNDRAFPQDGDEMWGGNTSPELGFAVYAGQQYVVQFQMHEYDSALSELDFLGYVLHRIDTQDYGLGLGTHIFRSTADQGARGGDFTITYEIRAAPLPDLRPVSIKVEDLPGSTKQRVCMGVVNSEPGVAGPFEVALRVDGVVPPDGRAIATGGLTPGNHVTECVETALPTSGQHVLSAVVDAPHAVTEFNETNNVYQHHEPYVAAPPTPTPTPSPALPDLTVSAIRFKSQTPDGKDDCRDGRNDVDIYFTNAGAAKAGGFAVRLIVDGDDDGATDELVGGLEAGQERKIRLDNVRLKKGERALTAIVDAKKEVAEAKEDNNELKVTVRCNEHD